MSPMPETERDRLITFCTCQDSGHLMEFILDNCPGGDVELFIRVQLNPRYGVWHRCWLAAGYMLGKRSRFGSGHWESGGLSPESAVELRTLLDKFLLANVSVGGIIPSSSGTTEVRHA